MKAVIRAACIKRRRGRRKEREREREDGIVQFADRSR